MLEIGMVNIAMFFVIIGVCLIFIAAWAIKSESKIGACREEIDKFKDQATGLEREKFSLLEKISSLESSPNTAQSSDESEHRITEALSRIDSLEEENKKLKRELKEAKSSLEEVYKALNS